MRIHLSSVDSTNTVAKELLRDYPFVIVSADKQTAGRGRNGRTWEGDEGANVYISFAYRHDAKVDALYIAASMAFPTLATRATIQKLAPNIETRIKYPNDIQLRDEKGWSKVSGILTEHEFEGQRCTTTTIGIGINVQQTVFPDTIQQPCTSLWLRDCCISVDVVRDALISEMQKHAAMTPSNLLEEWKRELDLQGRLVFLVGSDDTWVVERILEDGRLAVRDNETKQQRIIDNGDSLRYID